MPKRTKPLSQIRRTKTIVSVPCPDCETICETEEITNLYERRLIDALGTTVSLPYHYLDLTCDRCHLQVWVALDEDNNPYIRN